MIAVRTLVQVSSLLIGLCFSTARAGDPAGTLFTFQGQLTHDGVPVTDTCAFEFSLWDDPDSTHPSGQIGPLLRYEGPEAIGVVKGLFSTELDFGVGAFNGDDRWLEVAVRCSTGLDYTTVQPRQAITAAPFASFGQHAPWSGLIGIPPDIADGDHDTKLSETQVEAYLTNGPVDFAEGTTLNGAMISTGPHTADTNAATVCAGSGVVLDGEGGCVNISDGYSLDAADGDPVDAVYVDNLGRVGIGTLDPVGTLTVDGTVRVLSHPSAYSMMIEGYAQFYDQLIVGQDSLPGLLSPSLRAEAGLGIGHGHGVFSENATGSFIGAGFGTNYDNLDLLAGGLSRMRILTDGRVGIGTYTPDTDEKLTVNGVIRSTSGGFKFPDGTLLLSATNANLWKKNLDNAYYTAGNVGIGEMFPSYPLTVDGMIYSKSGGFKFPDTTELTSAAGANIWQKNGNSAYYNGGNVGVGTASPEDRLEVSGGIVTLDSGADASITGIRIRENDALRWTLLYRTWQDDDLEILNEMTGDVAMIFKPDNKVGIGRPEPAYPLQVGDDSTNGNGAHVTTGGIWANGSDRNAKKNIRPIDTRTLLAKVLELPVTQWQYKGEADDVQHIGPMAQDFRAAFQLGEGDKHIGTLDADGVALAAIQGLHQVIKEKEVELGRMQKKIAEQQLLIAELLERVVSIELKEEVLCNP